MPPRPSCATMRYFPIVLSIMNQPVAADYARRARGEFNCMPRWGGCQLRNRAIGCGIIATVTRCLLLACASLAMAACTQPSPATPPPTSSGAQTITGTEHLAWDQQAGSAAELATFN